MKFPSTVLCTVESRESLQTFFKLKKNKLTHVWTYLILIKVIKRQKTIDCIREMIRNEKNGQKNLFSEKIRFQLLAHITAQKNTKNKEKLMNRFFTKSKKPYFWAFLGKETTNSNYVEMI